MKAQRVMPRVSISAKGHTSNNAKQHTQVAAPVSKQNNTPAMPKFLAKAVSMFKKH